MQSSVEKLESIFQKVFKKTEMKITHTMLAGDIVGWDSLTNIVLILEIQKAFQIKFTANEVIHIKNVGDLIHLIEQKLLKAPTQPK